MDLVEEEGVAELVSEGLALEEEVDTGNGVSVKQFKKGNSERRQRPLEHVSF